MKLRERVQSLWTAISGRYPVATPSMPSMGLDENFLVDFRPDRFGFGTAVVGPQVLNVGVLGQGASDAKPTKRSVKPIDVLSELGKRPTAFSLDALDEKIAMFEAKRDMLTQVYAKIEVEGLLLCLKNRKFYQKYAAFFSLYDTTDEQKIAALLDKYDLVMKPADIFIPEFPKQATNAMKDFTKTVQKMCGKKPLYFVIATPDSFGEKYKRRDPILLAQSPFGFYYYILGAWDEEMLLLSEL